MAQIMMDIETLGTNFNCVVIQVSMVKFDWNKNILGRLTLNLSMEEQLMKGRTIDQDTIDWWKKQNKEIFESCIKDQIKPYQALNRICAFVEKDDIIWSHATFDAPIMNSLFKDFDLRTPWKYTNARDIRTLIDMSEVNLNDYNWEKKTHNSMDDCEFQIDYCCDARNSIKKWKDVFIKTKLEISPEDIEEKIKSLKNEYMQVGKEKTAAFIKVEQTEETRQQFNNAHNRQIEIINEINTYEKILESKK